MNKNRKYWKSHAKKSLRGHWAYAIGGCVIVQGISLIGSMLTSRLFPGSTTVSIILSELFLFVFSVVAMIFSTGYQYMLLNMARGAEFSFGDIVGMFRRGTDGVLTAGFVVSLISTAVQSPFIYMLYFADQGTTLDQQWIWIKTCLGFFVVGVILSELFTMPFALAFYILADSPEMSGMEALKLSASMMKGKMFKYIILELSFVPLLLLSVFTLYIALLWLFPYIEMTTAVFYMDANGEFREDRYYEHNTYGRADDYNSEA